MKKQTLIMLHGFRGTHHGLQLVARRLKNFEIIIPDMPGYAKGDKLASYDLDAYVTWTHELILKQKLTTAPILLGHSFGSIIASAYAAKYPDTIAKLILENPIGAPALHGPHAIISQLGVAYYWVGTKLPATLAHSWLSSKFVTFFITISMAKTKDKKLRAFIFDQHNRYFNQFHDAKSVADGFKTSISHNVRDFAGKISTPTLLIAAAQDDITTVEQQKELLKLFPNARLEIIENAGHLTHYETPAEVAKLIQAFSIIDV